MRLLVLCFVLSAATVCGAVEVPDRMHAEYTIGHITRAAGRLIQTDLGYVHGFRRGQELAVFRSDGIAWNPIGRAALQDMGSNESGLRVTNGARPQKGDLVLVAQSLIGYQTPWARNEFYVRRRILFRRNQNGYDTRTTAVDTRQLFQQKNKNLRWYRDRDSSELKLKYGSNHAAYKSRRVENLAKQCALIKKLQMSAPGALKSLSPRWTNVLPQITGYVEPPVPADAAEGDTVLDDTSLSRDLLPDVKARFAIEPEPVQEVFALLLSAILADPPANTQAYLRLRFKQTQFPQLSEQPDMLQELDDFLAVLN